MSEIHVLVVDDEKEIADLVEIYRSVMVIKYIKHPMR